MAQKSKKRFSKKALRECIELYHKLMAMDNYTPPEGGPTREELKEVYEEMLVAQEEARKRQAILEQSRRELAASEVAYYEFRMGHWLPLTLQMVTDFEEHIRQQRRVYNL